MTIKTFWTIVIKIFGMLLALGALTIIPQWFSTMYYAYESGDIESLIILNLILLVVLVIYYFVIRICLFKTSWIIGKLKLDNNFENQHIELDSQSFTIISIATIVIGGIMLIESIPTLVKDVFVFFQERSPPKDYSNARWILFNFIKIIIGYLLMTNSKQIAKFIESKKSDREDKGTTK
ncbi:hypothetical protein OIU80_11695 [Flavobacterium sp. LS1R47]|uniref:Uncharacterized protein n=1 Tax=Flavobacterium frigoritolerans TaxID=2987686 RepID=A0A9X2Z0Q6_9FLAO|nr:hypothetical protein [Flavobacterium frigoritolerans]MCV9932944.1 hypothetical protein [Flavobacterium frigoritolerans]